MVIHPMLWVLLAIALITQGTWTFLDARKRGENYWLWGILCLLNTPTNLLIYLIVTRRKKVVCPDCGKWFRKSNSSCPHCGGGTHICAICQHDVQVGWAYCPQCGHKVNK